VTGPIIDEKLAFRLAGVFNKRDGWMEDVRSNDDFDSRDRVALKGQLLFEPTDTFSARLIVDWLDRDESCCPATFKIASPTGAALPALGGDTTEYRDHRVGTNHEAFEKIEDVVVALEMNWDLGFAELVSITGIREFDVKRGQDVDFTNVDIYHEGNTVESFDNWSQELRLVGGTERFDWIVGGYVSGEDIKNQGRFLVLASQGPAYFSLLLRNPAVANLLRDGDGLSARFNQEADSSAVYTNNTWHISDQWDLNFGLRYTEEDKEGGPVINETGTAGVADNNWPCAQLPIATFCNNAGYSGKRSEDNLSGTIKLSWLFHEDTSTYLSFANGYKAGGFNLDPTAFKINPAGVITGDGREFEDETVESVELGLKSEWLDGTLMLNTALFFSKYEDFQLNTFTGAFFVVQNVPEVESKGIEVEYTWLVSEGIMLTGGVTYADSSYTDSTPIVNATAAFGGPTNLEGRQLTNSPLWQGSTGLLIDQELAGDW